MPRRGEMIEHSFAHLYDTGGMRRTHLRGYTNILKRLLVHAGSISGSSCVNRSALAHRAPELCMHISPVRGELVMGQIGPTSAEYVYL
jgi:hypothetical protein